MKLHYTLYIIFYTILAALLLLSPAAHSAIIDTYIEDFDNRQDDATIDEVDSWSVNQGEASAAITQDSTTSTGSGKALKLTGAETCANVSRSASYGDVSPCWIEFIVNPGMGAQARNVPSGKISALSFDYTGKIYTSDAASWVDTGETFTAGELYRIRLKLNFTTHLYDIYIEPVAVPETEFIPDKEGLNFIDSTISSLSQIGFEGVYSATRTDDTYIDDLIIHFVDRLEIITPAQTLMKDQLSNPITVQLQNGYSEPQTAWQDITLELRSSSDKGEFSLDKSNWISISQVIIPEDAQQVTFYYKDSKEGKPIISAKEYPDRGWEEATQQGKIVSDAASFDVAVTTPQVAGEDFTVLITAKDEEGDVNELYSGEIGISARYISPDTGTMEITPESVSGFSKGKLETILQYPDCGTIEIMVEDTGDDSKTGTSGEILFIPAEFDVSAGSPQIVNRQFQLSVSVLNTHGQVTPNYKGPTDLFVVPVFPEENSGRILPASLSEDDFSGGVAEESVRFDRWGTVNIKASDTGNPEKTGISEAVNFQPSGLLVEVEAPAADRDFYYVGENITINVSAVDDLDEVIPNYGGLINLNSSLGLSLPAIYQFMEADGGSHAFLTNASSSGFYDISAVEDASQLVGESPTIEVKEASIEVVSSYAPVGTTEVIIKLVDDEGNTIDSENNLTVKVQLEEEYGDSSASSSALHTPVTFQNGVAKILISNTQAEIVTISPLSTFDFNIKKGTVTFGRITKTGIGTLMWREIKE